jgi:two-component system chemotaxis sensor kinase CheA
VTEDEEFAEFLEIFQEESLERLVNVSRSLESLQGQDPAAPSSTEALEEVDRELHTIKGSARLLGFMELAGLVHEIEGLARAFRTSQPLYDLLVEACDQLSSLVEKAAAAGEDLTDAGLQARVVSAAAGGAPGEAPRAPEPAPPPPEPPSPPAEPSPPARETASASAETRAWKEEDPTATRLPKLDDETVRVRASRLTQLDEIVSELGLANQRLSTYEARLRDIARTLEEGSLSPDAASQTIRRLVQDYRGDTLQVSASTTNLERLAVDVRLRPVSFLFDPLPREARALARRLGKEVSVRVDGEDTEMDRVILEALRSPLTHLLRNSLDHGLEPPEERLAQGKPPAGLLRVGAGQEGSQVVIRIQDDGRGIDPAKIRNAAVQRGVITQAAAAEFSDEEAIQLIFAAGFSTKSAASDISGRGVGMDAVRRAVEELKGEVRVESWLGEGTRISLRLPLTLLISRVTLLRSGGQQFALPTDSVEESLRIPTERVATFSGRPSVLLRNEAVPLLRLAPLLGQIALPDPDPLRALVVHHGGERVAILVDELLEERSVVVKPLGWPLDLVPWTSGAILRADGEVALQLHVPQLFAHGRAWEGQASAERVDAARTVLIVDDSVISRQLVARAVGGLGFEPVVAVDGVEAWDILERFRPLLVVSDIEMPRLDGLSLVRKIRREPRLADLPVIILSNRGAEQDRQAGLEAGADAYITKGEFTQDLFRTVAERML